MRRPDVEPVHVSRLAMDRDNYGGCGEYQQPFDTNEVGEKGMEIWQFGRCPRCGGNIMVDGDGPDRYATCIQCGYEEYEGQEYKRPDVADLILPGIGSGSSCRGTTT
jgi:ribosomal protein S27AE